MIMTGIQVKMWAHQWGMLMCKVAFSSFSSIQQSAYRTIDWVMKCKSDFYWVACKHRRVFPINENIIPMLTCAIRCIFTRSSWSRASKKLFSVSLVVWTGGGGPIQVIVWGWKINIKTTITGMVLRVTPHILALQNSHRPAQEKFFII